MAKLWFNPLAINCCCRSMFPRFVADFIFLCFQEQALKLHLLSTDFGREKFYNTAKCANDEAIMCWNFLAMDRALRLKFDWRFSFLGSSKIQKKLIRRIQRSQILGTIQERLWLKKKQNSLEYHKWYHYLTRGWKTFKIGSCSFRWSL